MLFSLLQQAFDMLILKYFGEIFSPHLLVPFEILALLCSQNDHGTPQAGIGIIQWHHLKKNVNMSLNFIFSKITDLYET